MTTATKKGKAGKAGKAAAIEAPGVEIPKEIRTGTLHESAMMKIADIEITAEKNDRVRDAAFDRSVRELAANIARNGLLNPITVVPLKGGLGRDGVMRPARMALVAGERRLRACKLLGWTEIPTVQMSTVVDPLDARAAENLQREDLDEDVKAFTVGAMIDREVRTLLGEQGVKELSDLDAPGIDAINVAATKRVAERMGWPVSRVRDYAFVSELPEEVQSLARQGRLPMGHLRVLAQVPDPKRAIELAENYAAGENPAMEPVKSLDHLKTMVSRETCRLAGAPWDLTVAFAGGPACVKCPHNSANRTGLFDGADLKPDFTSQFDANKGPLNDRQIEVGLCSKLSCYRAKTAATKAAWRGAGDRIAAKVKAAKPAERDKLLPQLVKDAAAKCAFIPVTVMGKLVRERAQQRLEAGSSKGKAKASADRSVKARSDEARWNAQSKLFEAIRKWCQPIQENITKLVKGWPAEQQAMLFLALAWTDVARDCIGWNVNPKASRITQLAGIIRTVASMPATDPLGVIASHRPKNVDLGPNFDECEPEVLKAIAEVFAFEVPPIPQLADYLPKAEAKKPAAEKKSKPANKAKAAKKGPRKSSAAVLAQAIVPDAQDDDTSEEE